MTNPSKARRRLGMVGAAAVVGLVPVGLAGGTAFAASGATLALASTAATATTTATNSFNTTNTSGTQQIVIQSNVNAGTGTAETLPNCISNNATAPAAPACTNYTVSYTSGGTTTSDAVTVAGTTPAPGAGAPAAGNTATLALATPIPNGAAVTVTITGVTNGSKGAVVYFTDTDNTAAGAGGTAANTNTQTLTAATPVATPGVSSVNPTALNGANGSPFTITGTNFAPGTGAQGTGAGGTAGANPPVVCFVKSGSTTPATTTGAGGGVMATNPCTGPSATPAASVTNVTSTQVQGTSPAGLAAGSYNVVVYNYDPNITNSAGTVVGGYTAASGTTSQTLVGVSTNLNFVPEAGVRLVDSRSGLNLPKGVLTTGTPIGIQLSNFNQSPSMPSNLPAGAPGTAYTGLVVNVTAVAPATGGNLQVWAPAPVGGATPVCTNGIQNGKAVQPATVNFQPPQDTNNSQVIGIPVGAAVLCIQDNGASVNAVIDLTGYTTAGYTQVNKRDLDTRSATQVGSLLGPLQSNTVYRAQVCGPAAPAVLTCPAGTSYVAAFNIAAVAPSAPGNLRAFPEPTTGAPSASGVPNAAVDNYIVNTDSSAMLITTVNIVGTAPNTTGYIDLYSAMNGSGTVNAVIDELGDFGAGSSFTPVAQPYRIYDSRPGPIPAAGTVTVVGAPSGTGSNFTPASALGLVGNLSDINPAGQGYLVTYPAGGVVPGTASEANFPNQTRNTNNIVALNPSNGSFSIYAGGAATNTTFDVSGYIS